MYSYDWIVLVTLGLDRWKQDHHPRNRSKAGCEAEFEAAKKRFLVQKKTQAEGQGPEPKKLHSFPSFYNLFQSLRKNVTEIRPPQPPQSKGQVCSPSCTNPSERAAS